MSVIVTFNRVKPGFSTHPLFGQGPAVIKRLSFWLVQFSWCDPAVPVTYQDFVQSMIDFDMYLVDNAPIVRLARKRAHAQIIREGRMSDSADLARYRQEVARLNHENQQLRQDISALTRAIRLSQHATPGEAALPDLQTQTL